MLITLFIIVCFSSCVNFNHQHCENLYNKSTLIKKQRNDLLILKQKEQIGNRKYKIINSELKKEEIIINNKKTLRCIQ